MSDSVSARPIGHHFCPFANLVIQGAADTLAAARFAKLLADQSEIPGRYFDRGIDKWLSAVESGTEAHVVDFSDEAIAEIEEAHHPHCETIITLIRRVVDHTKHAVASRDPRYQIFGHEPFELRGRSGLGVGAAILDAKRAAVRSSR
jgi:hypothetical protein